MGYKNIFAGIIGAVIALVFFYTFGYLDFKESKFAEWTEPNVIATLIGGLGGALAGTVISGYNASKLWNKQYIRQGNEKKALELRKRKIFNSMIYAELKDIESHSFNLIWELTEKDEIFEDGWENREEIIKIFYKHYDEVEYCVALIENAYREAKSYSYSDIIDYDILGKLANVHVRTNRLSVEFKKYEFEMKERLEKINKSNPKLYVELTVKTIIGLNLCRKLMIDLYDFFAEDDNKSKK